MTAVALCGRRRRSAPTSHFSVPTHVARRNGIEQGATASVSLLADGIHLMPAVDVSAPSA